MTFRHALPRLALLAALASMSVPAPAFAGSPSAAQAPRRTQFHFDGIPVRSALQLLAEEGGVNLVVSDSVTGTVSLHLEDVTWEQALAVVVRLKGLDLRVVGNSRTMAVRAR